MKLTALASAVGFTNQECSRHLTRLIDSDLVEKNVDSFYVLTLYGRLVVHLQPSMHFIIEQKDYFTSHSLSQIPREFLCRIGELREATYVDNLTLALYSVEKIVRESEKYLIEVSNQYLTNTIQYRNEALIRGVEAKFLDSHDMVFPSQVKEWYRSKPDFTTFAVEAREKGQTQDRILIGSAYILHMSENEAFLTFPLSNGDYDYRGFISGELRFLKWCQEIFESFWKTAKTRADHLKDIYLLINENREVVKEFLTYVEKKHVPDSTYSELSKWGLIKNDEVTVIGEIIYALLVDELPSSIIDFERPWLYIYKK
jgi:predicted transcriptional regulator